MSVATTREGEHPEEERTFPNPEWSERSIVSQVSESLQYAPIRVEINAEGLRAVPQAAQRVTLISWGGPDPVPSDSRWSSVGDRMAEYEARIEDLRSLGAEDGIDLRQVSLFDFARFIRDEPPIPKASLVLTDSGNVRAVWRGAGGRQIGIQFRGSGTGSYVLLEPGSASQEGSVPYGELTLAELKELVLKFIPQS